MLNTPGHLPGCSGTRNLSDNLSDLRAQVAANRKVSKYFFFKKFVLSGCSLKKLNIHIYSIYIINILKFISLKEQILTSSA